MCIAIVCPIGTTVSNEKLYRGWTINNDGGGFAYVDENDRIVIKKGFNKYGEFHAALTEAMSAYGSTSPFLIHMRIRSQGDKGMENTHPFLITPEEGPEGALIHNGTMFSPTGEWVGTAEDKKSDTRVFAEILSSVLCYDDVLAGKALLGKAIGHSRMAFLYANREYVILSETSQDRWEDGVWYSNGSCAISTWRGDGRSFMGMMD